MSEYSEIRRQILSRTNLGQFLEIEVGLDVTWNLAGDSGMAVCPFHGDTDPSFSISEVEGVWLYNCFGCSSAGTIIEFFMEYYSLNSVSSAMELICERFDIEDSVQTISDSFAAVGKGYDLKKRCARAHMGAANKCRLLLTTDPKNGDLKNWVSNRYCEMNQALMENDYTRLDEISEEASCVIREN